MSYSNTLDDGGPGTINGASFQEDALVAVLRAKQVIASEIEEILALAGDDPAKLRRLVVRKNFGEPNAYLRGHVQMLGRRFDIDRRCYIPDADAQLLGQRIIEDAKRSATVLEIGTGCGWLSVSMALERSDLEVHAVDIDPGALSIARENARRHEVTVTFHESFFADDVAIETPDYVVANIPYGGDANYTERELEERPQMPPIALFDPAGVVKPLVDFMASIRRRRWSTRVYLETGYLSAERLEPLFEHGKCVEHCQRGEYGYLILET